MSKPEGTTGSRLYQFPTGPVATVPSLITNVHGCRIVAVLSPIDRVLRISATKFHPADG